MIRQFASAVIIVAGLVAAIRATPSQGQGSLDSPNALGEWVTFYYQHPEPQRLVEAMVSASRLGLLRNPQTAPPMYGFLAGWFSENESTADAVMERLVALPATDQPVLVSALGYSDMPGAMALLAKYGPRMPSQASRIADLASTPSHGMTTIAIDGAGLLDALWGYFSATGKEAPVVKIMSALPWSAQGDDMGRRAIGDAARWSLTSNAVQHPRVLEICRAQLARQPKDVTKVLADVIKDAEKALKKKPPTTSAVSFR